ncbi:hypothetical protein [Providencia hangzhouensis]
MTIATEVSKNRYVGNGVTTDFSYQFKVFSSNEIKVVIADSKGMERELKENTDYQITSVGKNNGGIVKLNKPLNNEYSIVIYRQLKITQPTSFRNQGKFYAETHEDSFDRNIMISQQQQRDLDRAVKVPLTADYSPDELICEIKKDAFRAEVARDESVIAKDEAKSIADKFGDIDHAIDIAVSSADSAKTSEINSESSAQRSEAAASNATVNANVYPDIESGLAAVEDGQQFQVNNDDVITRYRRESETTAVIVATFPNSNSIAKLRSEIDSSSAAQTLQKLNPNLFTIEQCAAINLGYEGPVNTSSKEIDGIRYWVAPTGVFSWGPFPKSSLDGDVISAAVNVVYANISSVGNIRFGVQQYDSSNTEIANARREVTIRKTEWNSGFIRIPLISIDENCSSIRVFIGTNSGGDGAEILYRDMLLCGGGNTNFRVQEIDMSPYETKNNTEAVASLTVSNPNLFTAEQCAVIGSGSGSPSNITIESIGDIPYWKTQGLSLWGLFDRQDLKGDTLSAAVNVSSISGFIGGGVRFTVQQYPAFNTNNELTTVRSDVTIPYAKFTPGFLRFENVRIHPDCKAIRFAIGVQGGGSDASVLYRDMLLCSGNNASFRVQQKISSPIGTTSREVWVDLQGSDAGSGSKSNPFLTLNRAAQEIGGEGVIYVSSGSYGAQSIQASLVKDLHIIGAATKTFGRSLFNYGDVLVPLSVSGHSNIYQSPLAIAPKWLWVDGLPDEQTLVPFNEQHCFLNGRDNRLECTKIWHIVASNLQNALAIIEASETPACWHDKSNNVIYYSLPSQYQSTMSVIASTDDTRGLITGNLDIWQPQGRIAVTGIDLRYGLFNGKYFSESELYDMSILGAADNCYSLGNWVKTEQCRAAGAGSGGGTFGDGFNVHNHAIWSYRDIYSHDNNDDGESTHQNCRTAGYGSVMEYNGGGGFTPANGAQEVLHNCLSRKNGLLRWKQGGFMTTGGPQAGDNGVLTSLEAYNCVSIGDKNGFYDSTAETTPTNQRLLAVNCRVFDAKETAFACSEIIDCSQSGSAQEKSSATVSRNTILV